MPIWASDACGIWEGEGRQQGEFGVNPPPAFQPPNLTLCLLVSIRDESQESG